MWENNIINASWAIVHIEILNDKFFIVLYVYM